MIDLRHKCMYLLQLPPQLSGLGRLFKEVRSLNLQICLQKGYFKTIILFLFESTCSHDTGLYDKSVGQTESGLKNAVLTLVQLLLNIPSMFYVSLHNFNHVLER